MEDKCNFKFGFNGVLNIPPIEKTTVFFKEINGPPAN